MEDCPIKQQSCARVMCVESRVESRVTRAESRVESRVIAFAIGAESRLESDRSLANRSRMIERSIYAILRREVREGRLRVIREEDRVQRCEVNERRERAEVRRLTSFERFICERELCI